MRLPEPIEALKQVRTVQGLKKSYKSPDGLRSVDFGVARGSTFALPCSNGSGVRRGREGAGSMKDAAPSGHRAGLVRRLDRLDYRRVAMSIPPTAVNTPCDTSAR